ncbi:MAG: lysophospholipid acyltransferase family protein [Muribaculaceae bacterium]|nr:lysophospholipid acyltransferase family protein [Muribaculaceae bacterium]
MNDNSKSIHDAEEQLPIKRNVLDYDDVCKVAPFFKGKEKLVNRLFHWLAVDKTNDYHARNMHLSGPDFSHKMFEELGAPMTIRNEEVLSSIPDGPFITVSNHPYGALDGMALIDIVGHHRPDFKVMVNMILNHIGALRPNFIAVDALASNDPTKRAVSVKGITDAMRHVKQGHPLGFFPAGAVSKLTWGLRIEDREWQPSVLRIIQKLKVPIIPIYFHGHNSWKFTLLGMIDWRLRTLRLPTEVFNKKGYNFRVSIGDIITPETLAQYSTPEELGAFLKQETYKMKKWQQ